LRVIESIWFYPFFEQDDIIYHTWSLIRCNTVSDTLVEGLVLLRIVWFTAAKVLCTFLTSRTAKLSSWLKNVSTGHGLLSPLLLVGNSVRLTPLFNAFHRSRMGWTSKCQSPFMCSFVPMRPTLTPIYSVCQCFYKLYHHPIFMLIIYAILWILVNLNLDLWNLCKYNIFFYVDI